MGILNDENFIKKVEDLVNPIEVSNLLFYSKFKKLLPRAVFKKILANTTKKIPYMGFIIEPYSLFLFFKLKDIEKAKAMLPDRYELRKTKMFTDDEPEYYFGVGNLNTRASTFWGVRSECYLIAEDKETGLMSWIFIDILSNTIIAVPSEGIADPNSTNAVFTTSSKGDVYLDVKEDKTERHLSLKGNIKNGKLRKLDQDIWLMGNTSIAHSRELSGTDENPFAVIFDPAEVEEALDIPVEDIQLRQNTLFPGLAESELSKVLCFPFTQHYIANSPGRRTYVKNRDDMVAKYNKITELDDMKTFSTKGISRLFFIVTPVVTLILIILLTILL